MGKKSPSSSSGTVHWLLLVSLPLPPQQASFNNNNRLLARKPKPANPAHLSCRVAKNADHTNSPVLNLPPEVLLHMPPALDSSIQIPQGFYLQQTGPTIQTGSPIQTLYLVMSPRVDLRLGSLPPRLMQRFQGDTGTPSPARSSQPLKHVCRHA